MRELRHAAGLDQPTVARHLRCTVGKVSLAENCERPFRLRDLSEVLLSLYDVDEARWPEYLDACERSHQKAWWDHYDEDTLPRWYARYVGLEQGALSLRGLCVQLVHGLLQTPAYARTIMAEAPLAMTEEDAATRTEVRLARQAALERQRHPLHVHLVLDEAVLRRVVGGPEVMAEQLDHLATLAEWDTVTLQVMPFDRGYYFDGQGEPVILGFPWDDDPGVVYVEGRTGGDVLDAAHDVADYAQAFDHARHLALPTVESAAMIRNLAWEQQR
jgi:hypothetical protein